MTRDGSPVAPDEFAALMAPLGPFAGDRRVAVAVSGGADSMALALLLRGWGRPLALVVDHGLRAASAGEAAATMQRLHALGIPAQLLHARLLPGPALAARARAERYRLLAGACWDAGCADLLLAHHLRDQAETLLLRRVAGSGAAGLAGMAVVSFLDAARVLRPLLGIQPAPLRATLRAAGVEWVEDPSNADLSTPRARLRAGALADPDAAALAALEAAGHGRARAAAEAEAAVELAATVTIYPEGYAYVSAPLRPDALSALVWCLSGAAHPPPAAQVLRQARGLHPGTLHGLRVARAGQGRPGWLLGREPAAAAAPVPAGQAWDGRFRLAAPAAPGATLGALGGDAARFRRWSPLPSWVLQTLPTLRRDGAVLAVPHLHIAGDAAGCGVPILFCPARPLAPAAFVAA